MLITTATPVRLPVSIIVDWRSLIFADGSYYYKNGNGSTYHNTGSGNNGSATYTAPNGNVYKK
jgi:hypothetical protein